MNKFNNNQTIQTDNIVKSATPYSGGPNYITGTSGLDSLVRTLDNFVTEQSAVLDKRTVARAKKAGAMAGLNANFTPAEGNSLAVEAFNSSAYETFVNKTITDVSTTVNGLSNKPELKSNPTKLREALMEVGGEIGSNVPEEVYPVFALTFNRQVERAVQGAQNNLYSVQLEQSRASFIEMEKQLVIDLTNAARDGDNEAVGEYLALYNQRLEKNAPIGSGGNGILGAEEFESRLTHVGKMVERETITGEMLRLPDNQKPAFIEGLLQGDRLDKFMTPDEQIEFSKDMVRAYEAQTVMKENIASKLSSSLVAEAKELEKQFVMEPTEENFMKLMVHPKANNAFQYKQYLDNSQIQSDPIKLDELEDKADRGTLTFEDLSFTDENGEPNLGIAKISPADRQRLLKEISDREAGGGFEESRAYKEFLNRLDEDYSRSDVIGRMVPNNEGKIIRRQVYDYMRDQWPKYQRGEVEFPDPIRKYNSVKQHYKGASDDTKGIYKIKNADGVDVIVPQKYIDNPDLYDIESKQGVLGERFDDPLVRDFISEIIVNQETANGK